MEKSQPQDEVDLYQAQLERCEQLARKFSAAKQGRIALAERSSSLSFRFSQVKLGNWDTRELTSFENIRELDLAGQTPSEWAHPSLSTSVYAQCRRE